MVTGVQVVTRAEQAGRAAAGEREEGSGLPGEREEPRGGPLIHRMVGCLNSVRTGVCGVLQVTRCKGCGCPFERPYRGRGSKREWCSNSCRQATIRSGRAERANVLVSELLEEGCSNTQRVKLLELARMAGWTAEEEDQELL